MSNNSSVIEINGKRYDAITGKLLGAVKKIAQPAASGSIDGFTKVKSHLVDPVKLHSKQLASSVHKKPQKSKALMRRSVKRPAPLKSLSKTIATRSLGSINPARISRASLTPRSPKISKYASLVTKIADAKTVKTTVKESPALPSAMQTSQTGAALTKPLPSMITSVSHQRLERMLDEALARADAHKKMIKQLQKRSWWQKINFLPSWLTIGVGVIAVLSASTYLAWQKVPSISLKMAASKAKISAGVPSYKPEGFAVSGPVKYSAGSVVVNYSAAGNQDYSLVQKASDWDSVSLAANAIPSNTPVQTSQIKGTTVYIYGKDNDATWVNNGIHYTLKDKANLSSDQIIKIVNSL